jgi:hypothetical protein
MKASPIVAMLALSVLVSACGDGDGAEKGADADEFPTDATCGLILNTQGALELAIPPSAAPACLTQTSSQSGLDVTFFFSDDAGELEAANLAVELVEKGETGAGFLAALALVSREGGEWESPTCIAEITEHTYVGPAELDREAYRVAGSLECEPLQSESTAATGSLELTSMAFVATVAWE